MSQRWSAGELARALGQPHAPTPEQAAVIEAPLRPLLVVAGAGSGKTETMAARVVWLVANGMVQPEEVLGLTFTRKAATELSERIASRLSRLRSEGLWTPPQEAGAESLGGLPTVSTYHAYAGRLVREHGLRVGVEPEARLLSEAAAWQLAHEVVVGYDGPMDNVIKAESTITAAVLDLASECAEHLLDVEDVEGHLHEVIEALEAVPRGDPSRATSYPQAGREAVAVLRERLTVLPMVRAFRQLKMRRDSLDFGDQVRVAAQLASGHPDIGRSERARFRSVLLDEFQDTSEAQLRLLHALFVAPGEPVPVTAVGDPHQSIYGWRGASATTLARYAASFEDGAPATVLPLSTSWRNDEAILAAANHLAAPLTAASRVPVRALTARPGAGPGHLLAARLETLEEEAAYAADWLAAARRGPGAPPTAAVLCRKRSQFDPVIAALEERGIPYEVVGLGGLLLTPEVADLVAALTVVADPTRGDRLMRLLTGPACRLGAADLDGIWAWARLMAARSRGRAAGEGGGGGSVGGTTVADRDRTDGATLAEALDELPPPGWTGPNGEAVSELARARLRGLGSAVRVLREQAALPLPDLVLEAEQLLGLDIEVVARPEYSPAAARAHLDAFAEVAAGFAATSERPTLGGFIAWLEAALAEERGLEMGWIETREDAVSVLTVHAAKGLEWDVVVVPGLVEGSFPVHSGTRSSPRGDSWRTSPPTDKAWLGGLAGVPHDLRADRDGRPRFGWDTCATWDALAAEQARYVAAAADFGIAEERRLAYVALTRARRAALLTAHVWGTAGTPRLTSRFLEEICATAVPQGPWCPMPDPTAAPPVPNPRLVSPHSVAWPVGPDLARHRRAAVAASAVREALTGTSAAPVADPDAQGDVGESGDAGDTDDRWAVRINVLLAERDLARRALTDAVTLPPHLSASDLVALVDDPAAFADRLRRPMPTAPAVAARRGTRFHTWVEQHFGRAALLDLDELPGRADVESEPQAELAELQATFLRSAWADRTPLEIETDVETVIEGIAVRGRIDAVFAEGDDFVIVDWKTTARPSSERLRVLATQLAAYRIAWCRLRGVPPERVRAAFYLARTGETVFPPLPTLEELTATLATPR